MSVDTSRFTCYMHSRSAGTLPEQYRFACEEGVKPSERSRTLSNTTITQNAANYYAAFKLPLPPDRLLVAGAYELTCLLATIDSEPATCAVRLEVWVDGATSFVGSTVNITSHTAASHSLQATVSADTDIVGEWEMRLVLLNAGSDSNLAMATATEDAFILGAASGGCPRSAVSLTFVSPAVGAHENPSIIDGLATASLQATNVYPDDDILLTRYTDTAPSAAHSASGATAQAAVTASTISTLGASGSGQRTLALAVDSSRQPLALADTYYVVEAKVGAAVMATGYAHVYLNVTRPSLATLAGTEAIPTYTTETTPILRWANPNALADRWQVCVYDADDVLVHDSTETVSTATEYTLPDDLPAQENLYAVVTVKRGSVWSVDSLPGWFYCDNAATTFKITSHEGSSDSPELVTTLAPTLEWYFGKTQAAYNVEVFDSANAVTYASGWTASATKSMSLPADTLAWGGTYSIAVQVKDAVGNVYAASKRAWVHTNSTTVTSPTLVPEPDATTASSVLLQFERLSEPDSDDHWYEVEVTYPDGTARTIIVR